MLSGDLPRLRHNESDAVVAVSDQIIVAKKKPRAQRSSDDPQFGKDRFHGGVKRRSGQWLENGLAAVLDRDHLALPRFPVGRIER